MTNKIFRSTVFVAAVVLLCSLGVVLGALYDYFDAVVKNNRLVVSDTGIGIPAEHQSRIFERFYRVDKSHFKASGGTGLGLSIVKHAVQYHHGSISLESEPNRGTTISVHFDTRV